MRDNIIHIYTFIILFKQYPPKNYPKSFVESKLKRNLKNLINNLKRLFSQIDFLYSLSEEFNIFLILFIDIDSSLSLSDIKRTMKNNT